MINVSRKSKTAVRHNTVLHSLLPSCALSAAICVALTSPAYADQARKAYDIQPKPLAEALLELSEVTDTMVMVPDGLLSDKESPQLKGEFSLGQALDILLSGSGLSYNFGDDGSVRIGSAKEEKATASEESDEQESDVDEEIIVTGSRIARTPSQLAANVIVLDARELQAAGTTTLEDALRQLPQNIFGATPTGASVSGSGMSFNGALNITGASSVNLRGLGSEATLILVNGKRIGKSGVFGGISDITGIPLRSVERVEIMLDGASSIYGSDAVGGVVNIITRRDFDGGEATYEHAHSQLGGFEENVLTVSGSKAWGSGQIRATFEHFHRSNLDAAERPERIFADSSFGNPGKLGTFFLYQGELYAVRELLSFLSPSEVFALPRIQNVFLPADQDGTNLSRSDLVFDTGARFRRNDSAGTSLRPRQSRYVLDAGFDQQLQLFGQETTLSGSLYYSESDIYTANGEFDFGGYLLGDDPSNPFPGQLIRVGWSLPGFADRHYETDEKTLRWNLSLDRNIGNDWRWSVSAGQSESDAYSLYFNESIPIFGDTFGVYSPEYGALVDDGLNILAGDLFAANSSELLQGLIAPPRDTAFLNTESTADFSVSGTLLSLPGGDVHLAVGGSWRQEGLESGSRKAITQFFSQDVRAVGSISANSLPSPYTGFDDVVVSRTQRSAFSELLMPVVGSDNRLPGVELLNFTGSARYDSYHEQGSGSTWSLGMIWSPIDQVTVKAKRSTSYTVPTFSSQLVPAVETDYTQDPRERLVVDESLNNVIGTDFLGLLIQGGNPNLQSETASTTTVNIDITPELLPGFTLSAGWLHTEYKNRIGSPPTVTTFIPSLSDFAYVGNDYDTRYGNTLYRREDGLLVWDVRTVNTASVEVSSIDYQLRYNRDTDYGAFFVTVNISHALQYDTAKNPGDEPANQIEKVEFGSLSVIPAWNYWAQLHWSHRGLSASLNASTRSKTESITELIGGGILRRTTNPPLNMDLTLTYDLDEGDWLSVPAWLQGTVITLKVPRLLNDVTESERTRFVLVNGELQQDIDANQSPDLNANTADPIGRMFHLSVTKRF